MITLSSDQSLSEIAIANLGPLFILVPTETTHSSRSKTLGIPIPRRIYSEFGWAFDPNAQRIIGSINGLHLTSLFSDDSPFPSSKRLAQGIPLSFELSSQSPFPEAIASLSLFQYQFQHSLTFHFCFFQNLKPTFVRIYSFQSTEHFSVQVARCIHEQKQIQMQQKLHQKVGAPEIDTRKDSSDQKALNLKLGIAELLTRFKTFGCIIQQRHELD